MKFWGLAFLLALIGHTFAQHPNYYSINDENGLPVNEVYQVVQDKKGFIWIGCDIGLFRYDGFKFKAYKNEKQNGRSISTIRIDEGDNIWCRNFTGQNFIVRKDSLHFIFSSSVKNTSQNNYVSDTKGSIWIFDGSHFKNILPNGKQKKEIQATEDPNEMTSLAFLRYYKQSLIYLIKPNRLYHIDLNENVRTRIEIPRNIYIESGFLFTHSDSIYLFNFSNTHDKYEILKLQKDKMTFVKSIGFDKKQMRIYEILNKSENTHWVCTSNGAYVLDSLMNLNSNPLFPGKNISYVFRDREDLFWFTTLQDGIFVIPSLDIMRYDYLNSNLSEDNLTAISIYDKKKIIIGTHSGSLFELNRQNNQISKIHYPTIKTISTKKIYTLYPNIYASHGPLTRFDPTSNKINHFSFYNIRDMIEYKDSFIFVYPENIQIISKNSFEKNQRSDAKAIIPLGGREVISHRGEVILSLNDGLFSYREGSTKKIQFKGESIFATSMTSDGDRLFLGTLNHGILEYTHNGYLLKFNQIARLKEKEIKLIKHAGDHLWICTNLSLYRFNLKTKELVNISKSYGISGKNISSIQCDDEKVYLATYKGLVEFPQNISWNNPIPPNVFIQNINYQNKNLSLESTIHLPSDNSNLVIALISTSLRSKGNYQYKYRLLGLDTNWISIDASQSEIVYSTIPPGTFTFQVKAINENDMEGNIVEAKIQVDKFLYNEWWFYLIISLSIVSIIALLFGARIRYLKQKSIRENILQKSQLTALKAQMNPHFIYNALNSIQEFIIKNDIKNSNFYLSKFSHLMRKVLDASGRDKIDLQQEIELLEHYLELEKLRFGDDFTFKIIIDSNVEPAFIQIPPLIIQPFIENAIKHGLLHKKGIKTLHIHFEYHEWLKCTITDNGVGRIRSEEIQNRNIVQKSSFATKATEKRIALLNKYSDKKFNLQIIDLYQDQIPSGTKVIIDFPIDSL